MLPAVQCTRQASKVNNAPVHVWLMIPCSPNDSPCRLQTVHSAWNYVQSHITSGSETKKIELFVGDMCWNGEDRCPTHRVTGLRRHKIAGHAVLLRKLVVSVQSHCPGMFQVSCSRARWRSRTGTASSQSALQSLSCIITPILMTGYVSPFNKNNGSLTYIL